MTEIRFPAGHRKETYEEETYIEETWKKGRHKKRSPEDIVSSGLRLKGGGYLLSRIALQYHRRKWA